MFRLELIRALEPLGFALTETQTDQFCRFYEHLIETNKVMMRR